MEEILALRHELRNCWALKTTPSNHLPLKWQKPAAGAGFLNRSGKTRASTREKELAQLRAFAKAEFGVDEFSRGISLTTAKNKNSTSTASGRTAASVLPGKQSG